VSQRRGIERKAMPFTDCLAIPKIISMTSIRVQTSTPKLAARGPQLPYEPAESDISGEEANGAPPSSSPSPRGDRPDLSEGAWGAVDLLTLRGMSSTGIWTGMKHGDLGL
jgi:hypothetical protein